MTTENTTQLPSAKDQAAADKAYRKSTRPWFKKKRFVLPLVLVLIFIIAGISGGGKKDSAASVTPASPMATATPTQTVDPAVKAAADADAAAKKAAADAAKAQADAAAVAAKGTVSQQNAKKSAESYLSFKGFSRTGLIKQLVFEKFPAEDAAWAADHVTVDWNEQAAKSAKSYLDFKAFSHAGLVKQLVFEGFTPEQAESGVTAAGL